MRRPFFVSYDVIFIDSIACVCIMIAVYINKRRVLQIAAYAGRMHRRCKGRIYQ